MAVIYSSGGRTMPHDNQMRNAGQSEVEMILESVRALRERIVAAWSERAVILSPEEQERLRREIHETCETLTTVTRLR